MSKLLSSAIPPVSREFALELQKVFRPMQPAPGFDRDKMMQSAGEQRVVAYVLKHSVLRNTPSTQMPEGETEDKQEPTPKPKFWKLFTNRIS